MIANCDLIAECRSNTNAFMDPDTPDDEAGSQKHLRLVLTLAVAPPSVIRLKFRP
jgi:hypothetical protein